MTFASYRFLSLATLAIFLAAGPLACKDEKLPKWSARSERFARNKRSAKHIAAYKAKLRGEVEKKKADEEKEKKAKDEKAAVKEAAPDIMPKVLDLLKAVAVARKKGDDVALEGRLKGLTEFPIEDLAKILKDKLATDKTFIGQSAAIALGALKKDEYLQPLVVALKGSDLFVAEAAAVGMGYLGTPQVIRYLVSIVVTQGRPGVRAAALMSLGKTGNKGVVPTMIEALNDADEEVRLAGAVALGTLNDPRAIPPLLDLLKAAKDNDTRKTLAEALLALGHSSALPELAKLLTTSKRVRKTVWARLRKHPDQKAVLKHLLNAYDEKDHARYDLNALVRDACCGSAGSMCLGALRSRKKAARDELTVRAYSDIIGEVARCSKSAPKKKKAKKTRR